MNKEYIVTLSPFGGRLPNGTRIVKCEPRKGYTDKQWFKRVDNQLIVPEDKDEADGKFVLWPHEYKEA